MEKTFNANEIVAIFRRKLWIIIVLAVLSSVVSYIYSQYAMPKKYTSSVTLSIHNQSNQKSKDQIDTYSAILKSDEVLGSISGRIKLFGLDYSKTQIKDMIQIEAVAKTEFLKVSVSSLMREHSKIIADSIEAVAPPEITRAENGSSVEIVDKAVIQKIPSSPNDTENTIIGVVFGLITGILFVGIKVFLSIV